MKTCKCNYSWLSFLKVQTKLPLIRLNKYIFSSIWLRLRKKNKPLQVPVAITANKIFAEVIADQVPLPRWPGLHNRCAQAASRPTPGSSWFQNPTLSFQLPTSHPWSKKKKKKFNSNRGPRCPFKSLTMLPSHACNTDSRIRMFVLNTGATLKAPRRGRVKKTFLFGCGGWWICVRVFGCVWRVRGGSLLYS